MATRPWSFPASTMPVLVTLAYICWSGADVDWLCGVWALVGIVFFHACGNTWSDLFDYKYKVDGDDTFGAKTLTSGMFTSDEIRRLSVGLLVVAVISGLGLMLATGWELMWIGLGGVLCTLLYPWLKFRAWGDAVIFVCYALLPVLGTSFVATGGFVLSALWLSVPIGLITVAILHSNNTRDIATDNRAGISTLAMKIGEKWSVVAYCFEVLFPLVWVVGCVVAGIFPLWSLAVLVAAVPAVKNARMMLCLKSGGMTAIASLDEHTAKLQLVFSLLLSLSFFVASIIG